MPQIIRPKSNIQRNTALRNAKARKDQVPAMPVIPYTPATITWLDTFQPIYKAKFEAVNDALQAQTNLTAQVGYARKIAVYYIMDFVNNLNSAIRRDQFLKNARSYYGIALEDASAVKITNDDQILDWNERLTDGEADRIADGGTAITFPSIADVNAKVAAFVALDNAQAPAMLNYDTKLEELNALNSEADQLILKLWNETETAFDTGDKPSMRRKARLWGVVYEPTPGDVLSPEDYSIQGKITDMATGKAVDEAIVRVVESNTLVISNNKGAYLVPTHVPGTYNLQVVKNGYVTQDIPNVGVTADAVLTLNIQLVPATDGIVSGTVTKAGNPYQANLTIVSGSTTITTHTQLDGSYALTGVPPGPQLVTCVPDDNPADFRNTNTNVTAGGVSEVDFVYP